jgi:hypothetical protein
MSLSGGNRTFIIAGEMSAFDPKRSACLLPVLSISMCPLVS